MRIVKFTAENVKKLRAVEITPAGNVVEVTGPNGSGKSSVLDAIFYALTGTAGVPTAVVRKGEEKAFVKLDLGELVVTRHFTKGDTRLTVEAKSGARFPSPQRMLDDLVGSLSFDPLEFIRLKPREQLDTLRSLIKIEGLLQIEDEIQDFECGLSLDRSSLRNLEARLKAAPEVSATTPDELVDVTELAKRLQSINEANTNLELTRRQRDATQVQINDNRDRARTKQKTAGQVIKEAEALELEATIADEKLKSLAPLGWPVDTVGVMKQIEESKSVNLAVERKKKRRELDSEVSAKSQEVDTLVEQLNTSRLKRTAMITAATMPVDGLSFSETEVLLNGLPLGNASSGEQLRVSVALAMAANPKLRVIRIKDGSLLDESNLKVLTEMASASDYQVWVERVEDSHGRPCVVMEDGSAKS